MHIVMLIVSLFVGIILFYIATKIATLDTKFDDFYEDNYFDFKHGSRLNFLIQDGLSDKEAYEKIIVEQDKELLEKHRLVIFWAILTIVAGALGGAGLM